MYTAKSQPVKASSVGSAHSTRPDRDSRQLSSLKSTNSHRPTCAPLQRKEGMNNVFHMKEQSLFSSCLHSHVLDTHGLQVSRLYTSDMPLTSAVGVWGWYQMVML